MPENYHLIFGGKVIIHKCDEPPKILVSSEGYHYYLDAVVDNRAHYLKVQLSYEHKMLTSGDACYEN